MKRLISILTKDIGVTASMSLLIIFGLIVLRSIAPFVFPLYFVYVAAAILLFLTIASIDFDISAAFSVFLYIFSLFFLLLPIIFGQVTRGAVRWVPIGPIALQPAELTRPLLILFFATYLTRPMNFRRAVVGVVLAGIPLLMIFLQPSLGVTLLTATGIAGVLISRAIPRKMLIVGILLGVLAIPSLWFVMAPYQKIRVVSLLDPSKDPSGAGYNSIQSTIAVGSGKVTGRGLGQGVQTQLSFLPERHTDFIFASITEELGFVGATITLFLVFFLLYRLIALYQQTTDPVARGYLSGSFATLLVQITIHVGMNMGIFPITGLPLPLVSYGGSSLLATMIFFAIAVSTRKRTRSLNFV